MASQQQIYTEQLTNVEDLVKRIKSITRKSGIFPPEIRPWWRGHARQLPDWKLRPFVYRKDEDDPDYEWSKAEKFMLDAPVLYPGHPAEGDKVVWLQLMRHYGLPTRLLDWTRSPLIALFFAVLNPDEDPFDGTLWALNPYELNNTQERRSLVLFPDYPEIEQMAQLAFSRSKKKYRISNYEALAFFPKLTDMRMMLQQSVFTIHATRNSLEELEGREKFLAKLEISHLAKETLRLFLKDLGFTQRTLFPDLDHLARDLA